jgi:hypothetical protein
VRRATLVLVSVCALLVAFASPAAATDATVEAAWDGDDAQYSKLGKQFRKGLRVWHKSGNRKPGRALKANRRARKLLRGTIGRVKAQPSSSATGERAKKYALASMRDFAKELKYQAAIIRAITAGKSVKSLARRGYRYTKRSRKRSKRARALFRQAEREAAVPPA